MAKKDKAAEPVDSTVVIDVAGVQFSFPRDQDDWPTGAILAAGDISQGRAEYKDVIRLLLGADQWARIEAVPFRDYKEFLRLFSEAMDELNGATRALARRTGEVAAETAARDAAIRAARS